MQLNDNRRTRQEVPTKCENWTGFVVKKVSDAQQVLISRTRCKQWSCAYCAEMNRIQWRYRIADTTANNEHGEWSFCTFTARGDRREQSLADLRSKFPKIIRRMRRMDGPELCYIRVYERHHDGAYHAHMLVNRRFDVKQIVTDDGQNDYYRSDAWADWLASIGLGWKHDLRPLEKHGHYGIGRYVTKYMLKEDAANPHPPKLRRFQTSQNFAKHQKSESAEGWEFHGLLHARDFIQWWGEGFDVVDLNKNIEVESADLPVGHTNGHRLYSDLDERYE